VEKQTFIDRLTCDDVEDYSDLFDGWTHTVTQMEAGNFGYTGHSIRLPGLKVFIDNHTRSLRWCEYPHIPVIAIFIPLQSAGDVRWRGMEMSTTNVIVQGAGEEQHFVVGAHMQAIYIDISQQLIQNLRWDTLANGHMTVASEPRGKLIRFCFDLIAKHQAVRPDKQLLLMRNNLLRLLRRMLFPTLMNHQINDDIQPRMSDFEVLILCEEQLQKTGMKKQVTNADLARQIGISERRLYRAFETQTGRSPARYVELLRLHALRRTLLKAGQTNLRIADTMADFGFTNAGRTARRYSDLFYEYPKETVLRSKKNIC